MLNIKIKMMCNGCHSVLRFENDEHDLLDKAGVIDLLTSLDCPECGSEFEISVLQLEINDASEV
jgi:hypothetical protein